MTAVDDLLADAGISLSEGEQHRGQARMAYRLAEAYAGRLMYVHGIGWHHFDGARWVEDDLGEAKRAVLEVLRASLAQSLDAKELREDVRRCESAAGVAGVLDLAAALVPFAHRARDLDADPYLLNTASGTLDLRTMTTRPHDPADRITKVTVGSYVPDDPGSTWPSFLADVLPDAGVRAFLQRLAGVGLLGRVQEHVLAILTGAGANGKGTLYKAFGHALGDYAGTAEPDLFMHRDGAHPTGEMDLRGVRWVVVSESDKDRKLAEATMKRLTGGDTIKARRMRQDFVEFEPSHTPILVTNHLPKVSGDDPAVWRRLRVIPFEVVIPREQWDVHLDERLQLDADAVLAWAVRGYADYVEHGGLAEPVSVQVATEDYRKASDALARFLEECCLLAPAAHAETAQLFSRWCRWCIQDGTDPGSQKMFGLALDRRGYPAARTRTARLRRGLGLLAEESDEGAE